MRPIFEKLVRLQKVLTKRGVELWKIELSSDHFFLEQNPFKNSKYGKAYRMLKEKYPNFYMFWEIKNDRYTGRLLAGTLVNKEDIDGFISELLKSEEFMEFEDIKEEIEPTET